MQKNENRPKEAVCILVHSNRICIVTLGETHPILVEHKSIRSVSFTVGDVNRLDNKVSGKGKRGAQTLTATSPLCEITCDDGEKYVVSAGMKGQLVEVNEQLLNNPNLLTLKSQTNGYIAIILPKLKEFESEMERLLTSEQYLSVVEMTPTLHCIAGVIHGWLGATFAPITNLELQPEDSKSFHRAPANVFPITRKEFEPEDSKSFHTAPAKVCQITIKELEPEDLSLVIALRQTFVLSRRKSSSPRIESLSIPLRQTLALSREKSSSQSFHSASANICPITRKELEPENFKSFHSAAANVFPITRKEFEPEDFKFFHSAAANICPIPRK